MESARRSSVAALGTENRLTVSLLLVWTFAVAVVLVWYQPWVVERSDAGSAGLRLLVAVAIGGGVGAVLYWLVPGLRRSAFPCQPGHWLLLGLGFFWIGAGPASRFLLTSNQPNVAAGFVATTAVLIVGSALGKFLPHWRLGLVFLAAALLWRCYLLACNLDLDYFEHTYDYWRRELFLSLNWISGVLLVASAAADVIECHRRDILHFAGIAATVSLLFAATERYLSFLPWNW